MKFKEYGINLLLILSLAVSPLAAAQSNVVARDTELRLILDHELSTKDNEAGDRFTATVAEDVRLDGRTLIRKGAVVEGTISKVQKPKRLAGLQGQAGLTLRFDELKTNAAEYPITATLISVHDPVRGLDSTDIEDDDDQLGDVDDEGQIEAKTDKTDILTKGAIGVAAGALLGALFGNVSRGLILGSIGGAVAILAPKGKDVVLPEGAGLQIRLDRDLDLTTT
jgi:hypothetical protein